MTWISPGVPPAMFGLDNGYWFESVTSMSNQNRNLSQFFKSVTNHQPMYDGRGVPPIFKNRGHFESFLVDNENSYGVWRLLGGGRNFSRRRNFNGFLKIFGLGKVNFITTVSRKPPLVSSSQSRPHLLPLVRGGRKQWLCGVRGQRNLAAMRIIKQPGTNSQSQPSQ